MRRYTPVRTTTTRTTRTTRTTTTTTARLRHVARCFCMVTVRSSPVVDMMLHGDHGSAWRRRQRRLRSWWRLEQQSVAMALSAAAHHSFDKVAAGDAYYGPRAQKTDRAGAAQYAPRRQTQRAEEELAVCGQGRSRTLGCRSGFSGTLWSTLSTSRPSCRFSICSGAADQVIEVRKISSSSRRSRRVLLVPRTAEQLVEVPTDPAYALLAFASSVLSGGLQGFLPGQRKAVSRGDLLRLQRTIEQIVNTPVPRGCSGGSGGLQGFSLTDQNVAIPAPLGRGGRADRGGRGGLQGFPQGQDSTAFLWSRVRRKSGSAWWRSSRFTCMRQFFFFFAFSPK